jgi:hypothetical protein
MCGLNVNAAMAGHRPRNASSQNPATNKAVCPKKRQNKVAGEQIAKISGSPFGT